MFETSRDYRCRGRIDFGETVLLAPLVLVPLVVVRFITIGIYMTVRVLMGTSIYMVCGLIP